jgi:pimeloyl-ACP methyl ester carboxylesterase
MDFDPTREALFHPEHRPPLDDFARGWTLDQICAELSRLAYIRFEKGQRGALDRALTGAGFSAACLFNDDGTSAQAFGTVAPDGTVFVAFRGTEFDNFKDPLNDARILLKPWRGPGQVHSGFLATWEALRDPIEAWVATVHGVRLAITGHSLGAAMATLMASLHPNAVLVTFGSPRVGNEDFTNAWAGRDVRRYVDCTDIVARVPPPLLGYDHVHVMRYVDRAGRVRATPPAGMALLRDRSAARVSYLLKHAWKVWKNAATRSAADHAPINYVSALLGRRTGS